MSAHMVGDCPTEGPAASDQSSSFILAMTPGADGLVVVDLAQPAAHGPTRCTSKKATVTAEQAQESGSVVTRLADGSVETSREYVAGDWIVTNPAGERYVLDEVKFGVRHDLTDQEGTFLAKGAVRAISNPTGCAVAVIAPWGAVMRGGADCMFAEVVDLDEVSARSVDRYIIGGQEFAQTYAARKSS